jgi:hypothetical protein
MVSSVDWATEWRVVERLIDCAIPVVAACSLKSLRFGSDRQLCLRQKFFDGYDSEFGRVTVCSIKRRLNPSDEIKPTISSLVPSSFMLTVQTDRIINIHQF